MTLLEADVVEKVRAARADGAPLVIVGNGTKKAIGHPSPGTLLEVSGLRGIVAYEPEELIVTVRPGTPLDELEAALEEKQQRLGFDPPEWAGFLGAAGASTIGGAVSVDAAGPARVRFGGARDHLLGLRGVNGLGEAFKAGGRVVKNVTGFDIPKLACGAFGTLCVLTELTFRVFPRPDSTIVLAVHDINAEQGLGLLRKIWSSPLESTGLAYAPSSVAGTEVPVKGTGTALVRLEGSTTPLQEKRALLRALCRESGVEPIDLHGSSFARIGDGSAFAGTDLDVWRVYLPPSRAPAMIEAVAPRRWLADWAGGLLWLALPGDDVPAQERLARALHENEAQAVLMRASPRTRARVGVFQPADPGRETLTRAVKLAFDPDLVLNRGRLFANL